MRRALNFARTAVAACIAFAATGCNAPLEKPTAPAAVADRTRLLFERNCAICHGVAGEGKEVGTLRVPSLREGAALTDPDERLFQQISDGGKGMPPFKYSLDDRQLQDLVRFVREQIQGRK